MSPENNFAVISTIAAVLVLIFSVETSRRCEDDVVQAYEFASLPFGLILLLLIAFVIFYWVLPLAEILDHPASWGLGIVVLSLLLVLALFWFRSRLSLDWGLGSGVSIVLGAGGVLLGEAGRKQSAGLSLSHLTIFTGLLTIAVNFFIFAVDVLIVQFP